MFHYDKAQEAFPMELLHVRFKEFRNRSFSLGKGGGAKYVNFLSNMETASYISRHFPK